jgi:hypothetical protein
MFDVDDKHSSPRGKSDKELAGEDLKSALESGDAAEIVDAVKHILDVLNSGEDDEDMPEDDEEGEKKPMGIALRIQAMRHAKKV